MGENRTAFFPRPHPPRPVWSLAALATSTASPFSLLGFLTPLPLCRMYYHVWALALTPQVSDKRVTFAPETKSSASNATVPDDWGFRFVVEPLRGVHYRVVRELELICRFGGRMRSGSGPSAAGTTFGPQVSHRYGMNMSKRAIHYFLIFFTPYIISGVNNIHRRSGIN